MTGRGVARAMAGGLVTIGLLAQGCTDWRVRVRRVAALEHGCPESRVEVVEGDDDPATTAWLEVCGRRHLYKRFAGDAWLDETARTAHAGAGDESALAPAFDDGDVMATAWTDAYVLLFVRETHEGVMRCTSGDPVDVQLTLDGEGRVRDVTGIDPGTPRGRCIQGVFGQVDLSGEASPRRVRMRFAPTSLAEPEPEPTMTLEELVSRVRARIVDRANVILACTATDTIAVEATWDTTGSVRFRAHRTPRDAAVDECVSEAIGVVLVPSGPGAGRVLQPVSH